MVDGMVGRMVGRMVGDMACAAASGPALTHLVGINSVGGWRRVAWWRVAVAEGCLVARSATTRPVTWLRGV